MGAIYHKKLIIYLVLMIFLVITCSSDENTKVDDGLSFTLDLEKVAVKKGDVIKMTFKVTNLLNVPIELTFPSSAHAIFEIWTDQECINCIPSAAATVITYLTLRPHETKIYNAEWYQDNFEGQSVPPDNYFIKVYLDYYGNDTKLEVPFIITE